MCLTPLYISKYNNVDSGSDCDVKAACEDNRGMNTRMEVNQRLPRGVLVIDF